MNKGYCDKYTPRLEAFPSLSYAGFHWHEHARTLDSSEDIFDLSRPFYQKKSKIRESWLETYWSAGTSIYVPVSVSFTLLHLASFFGVVPLAQKLLVKEGWIYKYKVKFSSFLNEPDSKERSALRLAALGRGTRPWCGYCWRRERPSMSSTPTAGRRCTWQLATLTVEARAKPR